MAHYRRGAQPISDLFITISFVRKHKKKWRCKKEKKKIVCSLLCDKGELNVLQHALFPLTSCIHSLRTQRQNFQQHCYFTFISELISKVHQWHYVSKVSVILGEQTAWRFSHSKQSPLQTKKTLTAKKRKKKQRKTNCWTPPQKKNIQDQLKKQIGLPKNEKKYIYSKQNKIVRPPFHFFS